jgi:hypothetical protein
MPPPTHVGNPMSLSHFVGNIAGLPSWSRLYIPKATTEINLSTQCFPRTVDSRDLNDDEMKDFESSVARAGLSEFFSADQLTDIVDNLRQQHAEYTEKELASAIDFYWKNDAFIHLL